MKSEYPDSRSAGRRKDALVVIGMHRSGTSAMAKTLSLAGARLPDFLMPPSHSNIHGHWEPQDVADMNDRVLQTLDSGWSDLFGPRRYRGRPPPLGHHVPEARDIIRRNYGNSDLIVLKEPRVTILLDLWREALSQEGYSISYVIMVRHPSEVSESLRLRDGFPTNQSLLLWATYMLAAEIDTLNHHRIFVHFEDLVSKPNTVLDRIEEELNIILPRRTWDCEHEISEFIKFENKNYSTSRQICTIEGFEKINEFYLFLDSASRGEPRNNNIPIEARQWLTNAENIFAPIIKHFERDLRNTQMRERLELTRADNTQQGLDEIRLNLAEAKDRLTQMIHENGALLEKLNDADHRNSDLEQALALAQSQIAEQRNHIVAQQDHIGAYTEQASRDIEALRLQTARVEEARSAALAIFAEREATLELRLESARQEISTFQLTVAELETALKSRELEILSQSEAARAEIESARAKMAQQEADFDHQLNEIKSQSESHRLQTIDLSRSLSETVAKQEKKISFWTSFFKSRR